MSILYPFILISVLMTFGLVVLKSIRLDQVCACAQTRTMRSARHFFAIGLIFLTTACGHTTGDRALSGAGIGAGAGVGAALLGAPLLPAVVVGGAIGAATGAATSDRQINLGK